MTLNFRMAAHGTLGLACLLIVTSAAKQEPPWELSHPAPAGTGKTAILDRLDEISCGECHARVVAEWAGTTHALAWVDEHYQRELEQRRKPQACHGCHVPELLHGERFGQRPRPRAEALHFGVSCESCHTAPDGTQLGPRGLATDAHPTRASETMIGAGSNALCAACHSTDIGPVVGLAKDFERSRVAAEGGSCVACHMAPLGPETATEGRLVRSHALQTPRDPAFLRRAFRLTARTSGDLTVLSIENRAGHRVPGLVGRDLVFTAEVLDAGGDGIGQGELVINTRAHLPVDEAIELAIEARGPSLRVTAVHHDPVSGLAIPFLDERLELGSD